MHPKTRMFIALLPFLAISAIAPFAQAFDSDHLKQLLKSNQCSNCDLSGAPLEGTNLAGANLQNTNLSNANLSGTNLSGANLEGANLQNAILNNVYAFRANLTGAKLDRTDWTETRLISTELPPDDFKGAIIANSQSSLSNRTKESEARRSIGALNRAQQAYHLENDRFTTNLESTGVVKPDTANYRYRLFIAPDRYPAAMQVALPKSPALSTFIGFVYLDKTALGKTALDETATIPNLCVSEKPGTPMPLWSAIDYKKPKKGEPIACPSGFTPVK